MRKVGLVLLLIVALVLVACQPAATPVAPATEGSGDTGSQTEPTVDSGEMEATPMMTSTMEATPAEGGEVEATPMMTSTMEATETSGETGGEVATGECTDELGCVDIAAGDPIKLAAALVISGENASLGLDSQTGIELALAQRPEVLGHEIELDVQDDGCSPEGGQAAGQRIVSDEEVVAVIGTSCSGAARTAIPLITGAGLTMISPSNTAPDLTAEDRPADYAGYLRTAHNDEFQGRIAAEYAYNVLGARTAATIHDGSIYADSLQQVFADAFTELGGEVTSQGVINPDQEDMTDPLGEAAVNEPDVLYFPVFAAAVFIIQQAPDTNGLEETALMTADGAFNIDVFTNAGEAGLGVYLSGPYVVGDAYEQFLADYEEAYGSTPPSVFHAHAYDATNMILNAIEEVAEDTGDGGIRIGRQALRDALFATSGYQGLTGELTCDEYGDCATGQALGIFQITQDIVDDIDANWPPEVVFPEP